MNTIRNNIPYWMEHSIVAGALYWLAYGLTLNHFAGFFFGIGFYLGREVRDREKLGRWDWPGLIAPIVTNAILLALSYL